MTTENPDRRGTPRYPADTRIFASIDGQTVRISNISLLGVAIHGRGLATGSSHLLEININHRHIALPVQILDSSQADTLHARFIEPASDAQELIRSYISELD